MNAWIRPIFCLLPCESSWMRRERSSESRSARSLIARPDLRSSPTTAAELRERPEEAPRRSSVRRARVRPADSRRARAPGRPRVVDPIPNTRTTPEVGRMKSSRVRIVVVLPAPFGPRKPKASPRATSNVRSWTPRAVPYRFVSCRTSMTAVGLRHLRANLHQTRPSRGSSSAGARVEGPASEEVRSDIRRRRRRGHREI